MSEISTLAMNPPVGPAKRKYRRPLRRRSASPSGRDLAIFKKVELEQFTHEEAAHRFGLRRSRVTQIVKRLRLRLAQASTDDPQIENHLARQRLEQELEKLRLEFALHAAAKAMRREQTSLVTHRLGGAKFTACQLFQTIADLLSDWSAQATSNSTPPCEAFLSLVKEFEANLRQWIWSYRTSWGLPRHC